MLQRDTRDFLMAFALGVLAGGAAAFLLRGEEPSTAERIWRKLEPNRHEVRRHVDRALRSFEDGAAESAAAGDALREAGRELLNEVRDELASMVRDARKELMRGIHVARLGGRSRGSRVIRAVSRG